DANRPQAWVGTAVRSRDAYVRVLYRISPEAVRIDETVTGARFVDRPRAEGVDALHREEPVVILPVGSEARDVGIAARQRGKLRRIREEELHRQRVLFSRAIIHTRVELILVV